jgi:cobalamin synthase
MDLHDILLGLHTVAGVAGPVLGGLVIWLSRERPLLDRRSAAYQWTVFVVSLTAVALLVLDWPELWWLTLLAALAYGLALLGYLAPRRRFGGSTLAYAHGQGGSYIALTTAFLVVSLTVDGPVHGPAAVVVWVLPTLVGTGLIQRWHRRLEGETAP